MNKNIEDTLRLALEALNELRGEWSPAFYEEEYDSDKPEENTRRMLVKSAITALHQVIAVAEQHKQAQTEANERSEVEPVAKVVSTAPKQIWLDLGFDPSFEDEISFNDLCDATWSHDNATGYGIEYVRADLASPPSQSSQRPMECKPLTDEQIIDLWPSLIMHQHTYAFAKAIEAAHGIGKGDA